MDFANYWFSSGSGGGGGYQIGNSLRFRGSQHLERNFGTATSSTRGTWSFWIKIGYRPEEITYQSVGLHALVANSNNTWRFVYDPGSGSPGNDLIASVSVGPNGWATRAMCRDTHGWYHIVIRYDTTLGTAADRLRQYWNGVNIPKGNGGDFGQNAAMGWGQAGTHRLGNQVSGSGANFKGYMSEVIYVDGQSLAPTEFGEFNGDGVWVPREYTGTFGNNGFLLDFSDPANIGADRSGNGNNWTPTGFELTNTTSVNYDSVTDSPTSNYLTLSPLDVADAVGGTSLSKANLKFNNSSTSQYGSYRAYRIPFGNDTVIELAQTHGGSSPMTWNYTLTDEAGNSWQAFNDKGANTAYYRYNGSNQRTTGAWTSAANCAFRITDGTIQFLRNNSVQHTWTQTAASTLRLIVSGSWNNSTDVNFGQKPYIYSYTGDVTGAAASELAAPNLPATITGSFTGNNSSNGPFVYTGCMPGRIQYGSVDVTYGNRRGQNNVDFLCNGFKVRSGTSNSGTVNYTVTTTHSDGEYNGHQVPFGGAGVSPAPACIN